MTNKYRYFLESNFVGFNRLLVLIYPDQNNSVKRFNTKKYYLPKGIVKDYTSTAKGKNFYDKLIDSDIKRYEEIRKVTTRQGEDYTKGCLLDYKYVKNHYRLIAVDLSKQKELDADLKAIQQIGLLWQLKILMVKMLMVCNLFLLTILEKIKETRPKFSQGSATVL